MMDTQSTRYLIPRRITQRFELVAGWGWRQIGAVLAGLGVGVVLALLAWALHLPWWIIALVVLLPAGSGAGLAMPMPTGGSMLDMLVDLRAYGRTRHLYLYDIGRDDA